MAEISGINTWPAASAISSIDISIEINDIIYIINNDII